MILAILIVYIVTVVIVNVLSHFYLGGSLSFDSFLAWAALIGGFILFVLFLIWISRDTELD